MCGIAGAAGAAPDAAAVAAMCGAMRHRGPDDEGLRAFPRAVLAMRRLSIIDRSGGRQPIANEDGTIAVVFNGEIYNFRELRQRLEACGHRFRTGSDTEVIVHAYEQYGDACCEHLHGMFAFALWDEPRRRLLLARDRLGKKPLFYHHDGGSLAFASELRALLRHPSVPRAVDPAALDSYLSFLCVPAPATILQGVRKLEPGCSLAFQDGQLRVRRYWDLDFSAKLSLSLPEAEERLLELLRGAVRCRLESEVPLGAFLSGGVDSSIVVALMREAVPGRLQTFSIGFRDPRLNELGPAGRAARHFGTEHHELVVEPDAVRILPEIARHYGEPFADSSAVPTFYLARMARRRVTVALTGDGGDELFAGYPRYRRICAEDRLARAPAALRSAALSLARSGSRLCPRADRLVRSLEYLPRPPASRHARWLSAFTPEEKARLYSPAGAARTRGADAAETIARWIPAARLHPLDRALAVDTRTYLPDDLLVKLDIATMAAGLEARCPLLDHRVVEFAAALPPALKLRGRRGKYLLRRVGERFLPPGFLDRRKQGFSIPLARWLREDLREPLRDLLPGGAMAREWFDAGRIRGMIDEHLSGAADRGTQLWALLMLEVWHREVLAGAGSA